MEYKTYIKRLEKVEKRILEERKNVNFERGLREEAARDEYVRIFREVFEEAEEIRQIDSLPALIGGTSTILALITVLASSVAFKVIAWAIILVAWLLLVVLKKNREEKAQNLIWTMAMAMETGKFYGLRSQNQERVFSYAKVIIVSRPKGFMTVLLEFFGGIYDKFFD